ncbi:MAG: hypothetical protein PHH37_12120 [Paludibacter sp.]|nr:hypothetical protein [Paludibacter sp.]
MEKNITIEEYLLSSTNDMVSVKHHSPLTGIIFILCGVVCIVVNKILVFTSTSIVPAILIMATIAFAIIGLLQIVMKKTIYVDKNSGKRFLFREVFYNLNEKSELIKLLEDGNFKLLSGLQKSQVESLKLRVACFSDKTVAFVQVLSYIPYEYVSCTGVIKIEDQGVIENILH